MPFFGKILVVFPIFILKINYDMETLFLKNPWFIPSFQSQNIIWYLHNYFLKIWHDSQFYSSKSINRKYFEKMWLFEQTVREKVYSIAWMHPIESSHIRVDISLSKNLKIGTCSAKMFWHNEHVLPDLAKIFLKK
jgi:hypothetical protein